MGDNVVKESRSGPGPSVGQRGPAVAVIGAGVVGAAVALELSRRGARVTVYEADRPGAGTSGTSFAWVNANAKEPPFYHELNVEGMRAHRDLASKGVPGPPSFFPTGNLEWAGHEKGVAELTARTDRLQSLGYVTKRLSIAEALRLEPDLRVPGTVDHLVLFPEEGHVLPLPLIGRLLGEASEQGAELRRPVRVASMSDEAGGVGLVLDDGSSARADIVVSCVGRWTTDLIGGAGYSVPLLGPDQGATVMSYLAYTKPTVSRVSRVLTTPGLHVRPDGGGRLVLQSRALDESVDSWDPGISGERVGRELVHRLDRAVRGGDQAVVDEVRVGHRAMPVDGLTVAGYVDAKSRFYVVATHSGVTLAPLLGRLVADEVVERGTASLLEPFRPQRLATGLSGASKGASHPTPPPALRCSS